MKLRGFVRVFLFGCLAVCGLEALATGGIAGKPNFLEGGFTYYYPTAQGNISDADWDLLQGNPEGTTTNNVYGRIPKTVIDYFPPLGQTNVIYLSRTDWFMVPTNCEFHGTTSYTDNRVTGSSNDGFLRWSVEDGRTVFKASNSVRAFRSDLDINNGRETGPIWNGEFGCSCYFKQVTSNGTEYARLNVCFVNRSDAFYRVPLNDTYYVATNTPLWFRSYKAAAASPWVMDGGDNWSVVTNTANEGFDKFTITAPAGETFHITSEDGLRDITVHVVDPDSFSFSKHILYFDGTAEKRRLSTILYECDTGKSLADVAAINSADKDEIEVVKLEDGDWTLQAKDYFDVDREVTVTFTDGSVVLLKITSMTGRCDETLCASVLPKVMYGTFSKVLVDDAGIPCQQATWELTTKTNNAPPGYTNVMRVLNAALYHGKRYSVYIACKTPDFVAPPRETETPGPGVLWCVKSLRKIVCWLEDEDGRLFASPNLCIANSGDYATHPTRFNLGDANVLYSNVESGNTLRLWPYMGTEVNDQSGNFFQGATADAYGYCAIMSCAEYFKDDGQDWDEMTVFLVEDVRTVTVSKEAFGGRVGERFSFKAVYTDLERQLITNHFSIASGQVHPLMVATGGVVRVTEEPREGYAASVRMDSVGTFAAGTELSLENVQDDHLFEFRNVSAVTTDPLSLWITDHEDAGDGRVHLAFEPIFAPNSVFSQVRPDYLLHDASDSFARQSNGTLEDWFEGAKQRQAVHVAVAEKAEALKKAKFQPIEFRKDKGPIDPDHPWVWITADTSAMATHSALCYDITVDLEEPGYSGYSDEVIGTSAVSGQVVRVRTGESTDIYVFTNLWEAADVKIKRPSRVKSILLVGGGGAGGGMTGGGGAGGEVRLVSPDEIGDRLEIGSQMNLLVGKGGAPAQVDCALYSDNAQTYDVPSHAPGRTGGDTVLNLSGGLSFTALGGGGGGSYRSTYPGVMRPYGQGLPGANGGGSGSCSDTGNMALTGGVALVADGHVGGGAFKASKSGAGGGGGMQSRGLDGTQSTSGDGGEGVTLAVEGLTGVYGAGGGGGGNWQTTAGRGGTNAGNGGVYTTAHYTAANFPPDALGQDGADGYGAGGGGGALLDDDMACRGGRGGCGTAMIVLQDASVIDATCAAKDILFTNATLQAKVVSFADGESVSASYAYARRGESMPELQPVPGGESVVAGETVAVPVEGLEAGGEYDFVFAFVDEKGRRLVVNNSFTTHARYENVAYEDEYILVEGDPASDPVEKLASGEYRLSWKSACTNLRVLALKDLSFVRGLAVGGGGAGGSFVGAGGGGGGVRPVDSPAAMACGTELTVSVGAGGAAPGKQDSDLNFPGGASSIALGSRKIVAAGGGVGASRRKYSDGTEYVNGGNGASGGGGIGSPADSSGHGYGRGGAGIEGQGFAGGNGATRQDSNCPCIGGGGGGAGEPGQPGDRSAGQGGKGGEGLVCDISGELVVYGSGGGAGGDDGVKKGLGGTNGGAGGDQGKSGEAGVDGTGSGGGGAGYAAGSSMAGKGGDGAVIVRIVPTDIKIVAESDFVKIGYFSVQPRVKVLALGDGVGPLKVEFAVAKKGEELPVFQTIAEGVIAGQWVTNLVNGLDCDVDYAYRFRLSSGDDERILDGEFHSKAPEFEVGYRNDYFVTALGPDAVLRDEGGEFLLAATSCCTNVQILVRRDLVLNRALLVGGGGAGGSYIGGGGGGGGVTTVDESVVVPADTEMLLTVGAGGMVVGAASDARNGDGGRTAVTFGDALYEALGGGAGASSDNKHGNSGANGGGGMKDGGTGGAATNGVGFAGGNGCRRYDNNDSVGGGGGGAGARGQDGIKNYATNPNRMSKAGDGGEGVTNSITGVAIVYGSGGGAGADEGVFYGRGGTNAGDGGDHYASDSVLWNGRPGVDGTGGGGGGAGYHAIGYSGGKGGCGAIVLDLSAAVTVGQD